MSDLLDRPSGEPPVPLDDTTVDRLLDGLIAPEDAPAGYEGVARLVIAVRRPASPVEDAATSTAVMAAVSLLRHRADLATPLIERARRARRLVQAKISALVFAGTLVGTTGMAAAGALPAPMQDAAATVLDKVGIHVPSSDHGAEVSDIAHLADGSPRGEDVATVASRGHGHAFEDHGHAFEHGQANADHGKDVAPGRLAGPGGPADRPDQAQNDQPHGNGGTPHDHGRPDGGGGPDGGGPDGDAPTDEPHGQPDDPGPPSEHQPSSPPGQSGKGSPEDAGGGHP